jgi:hypothetical protein
MSIECFSAYVTKYALTIGIMYRVGEVNSDFPNMFIYDCETRFPTHVHAPYWHRTFEAARAHAEKLRKAKLASLKKQIAKLEGKRFDKPVNHDTSEGSGWSLTTRDDRVEK